MTNSVHARWRLAAATAIVAFAAGPALAAPTASDLLSAFNLVTKGNVSTGSDIVGNAVIGGALHGATFFGGGANVPADPQLILYGTLQNSINLNAGGDLVYAGAINVSSGPYVPGYPYVNFNGGGHQVTTVANALSEYTQPLEDLSDRLATLSATVGATFANGSFNAGGNSGAVVFGLSASAFESALVNHDITFSGPAGVTFIVNVSGDFTMPGSAHMNTLYSNVLFNFYDATKVNVGNWGASILAPDAAVAITGGGNISGSLFANSYLGGGELHNDNLFAGSLPVFDPAPPVAAAPEPSTWAMMIAGFASLAFFGLRSRRAASAA